MNSESKEELIEKRRIAAERDRLMKVWQKHEKVKSERKEWVEEREVKGDDDRRGEDGRGDDERGDDERGNDIDTRFYWHYGSADCWIPPDVVNIPSIDGANTVLWRGDRWVSTEIFSTAPGYTIEEYHQKFCQWNEEARKWIYK